MKRAIIFSNNKKLCRLVEIELMLSGYTVSVKRSADVSSRSKPYDKTYDCLIYDNTEQMSNTDAGLPPATFSAAITGQQAINVDADFDIIFEYPFSLDELRAAINDKQVLSKAESQASLPKEKCFYLEEDSKTVIYNGIAISLSEYELITLTLLCQKAGDILGREELSEALGAESGNIGEVYVCHLRRKLETPFGTKVIYTARGKGYYTDHAIKYVESDRADI